jgi:hypothetical protein
LFPTFADPTRLKFSPSTRFPESIPQARKSHDTNRSIRCVTLQKEMIAPASGLRGVGRLAG